MSKLARLCLAAIFVLGCLRGASADQFIYLVPTVEATSGKRLEAFDGRVFVSSVVRSQPPAEAAETKWVCVGSEFAAAGTIGFAVRFLEPRVQSPKMYYLMVEQKGDIKSVVLTEAADRATKWSFESLKSRTVKSDRKAGVGASSESWGHFSTNLADGTRVWLGVDADQVNFRRGNEYYRCQGLVVSSNKEAVFLQTDIKTIGAK